ncbi:hypothetical protein D3C76_736720 [compost metagenome]
MPVLIHRFDRRRWGRAEIQVAERIILHNETAVAAGKLQQPLSSCYAHRDTARILKGRVRIDQFGRPGVAEPCEHIHPHALMIHRHENHLCPPSGKYIDRPGVARGFQVDGIPGPHKRPGHEINPLLCSAGDHQISSAEVNAARLQMPAHDLPQLRVTLEVTVGCHQFRLTGYQFSHGCTNRLQRKKFAMNGCKMERILHLRIAEVAPELRARQIIIITVLPV